MTFLDKRLSHLQCFKNVIVDLLVATFCYVVMSALVHTVCDIIKMVYYADLSCCNAETKYQLSNSQYTKIYRDHSQIICSYSESCKLYKIASGTCLSFAGHVVLQIIMGIITIHLCSKSGICVYVAGFLLGHFFCMR